MAATATIDRGQARGVHGPVRAGHGRGGDRPARGDRRQARALQGDGRRRAGHAGGARRAHGLPRALRARVAVPAGRQRLRRVRRATATFRLPPEQALALADDDSPVFIPGAFQLLAAIIKDEPHITERFRTGEGIGWHEHDHDLFEGTERFFRPGYLANLVDAWLPSLDGVVEKLERGRARGRHRLRPRRVDDPDGAGLPGLDVRRLDYHEGSIEAARRAAERAGVADRVTLRGRRARRTSAAARSTWSASSTRCTTWATRSARRAHVRSQLADDGTWMVVEPFAGDAVEDNLNPVGRVFYAGSTMLCTPASLSQEVGLALGAQAGEARLDRGAARGRLQPRAADAPRRRSTWCWRRVRSRRAWRVSAGTRSPRRAGCRAGAPRPRGSRRARAIARAVALGRLQPPLEDEVADQAGDRHAGCRRCASPAASGSPGSRAGTS